MDLRHLGRDGMGCNGAGGEETKEEGQKVREIAPPPF